MHSLSIYVYHVFLNIRDKDRPTERDNQTERETERQRKRQIVREKMHSLSIFV